MTYSDQVFFALGVCMSIIFMLGVILNLIVIIAFARIHKKDKHMLNLLIISISISNFLQSTATYPINASAAFHTNWIFGKSLCLMDAFWVHWMALVSTNHLCVFSIERYHVIRSATYSPTKTSCGKKCLIIGICWIYALFWAVLPLFGWSSYGLEGVGIGCSIKWQSRDVGNISYTVLLFVFAFLIPVGIICVTYLKIYQKVKDHNNCVLRNMHQVGKQEEANPRAPTLDFDQGRSHLVMCKEKRIAKIGFIMACGFCLAWTPYAVVSMMSVKNPSLVSPLAATIPAILAKSSTCYFPIIFGITHTPFKKELARMMGRNQVRAIEPTSPVKSSVSLNNSSNE